MVTSWAFINENRDNSVSQMRRWGTQVSRPVAAESRSTMLSRRLVSGGSLRQPRRRERCAPPSDGYEKGWYSLGPHWSVLARWN